MKNLNFLLTALICVLTVGAYAQPEAGMPSEPGKCYAKCLIADQYETVTEQVLVKEATTKVATIPASFETVSEQVLAKEAATTLSVTPATFETVTEQVLAQEAGKQVSTSPATFETVSEQVIKFIDAPSVSIVPASFESVSEQVLVQDAYTTLKVVPATFETITEQVLVQDAYSTLRVVPATYETVTEQVLVKEAYSTTAAVPPITDLGGLLEAVNGGSNSYTTSNGITRTFTAAEAAAIKSLAGTNSRLSADQYGNVYVTLTEQVLEQEAYNTIATYPAQYETKTEQVLVKEAGTRIEKQPAGYETVTETIQTSPASTKWVKKKADKNCLSADPNDCLVWCLVEVPAQYKTVTKSVRKSCAAGWTSSGEDCIRTIDVPAEYSTRSFQTLASSAGSNKTEVAAKYGVRSYKKLIMPAATYSTQVPAQYSTRTYRKVATPASTTSVEVPAQYTTRTIKKLKSAATTEVVEIPAQYTTRTFKRLVNDAATVEVACGKSSILEGINFETGSARLTASSGAAIAKLKSMLDGKPAVTARLIGHTDSQGSAASNEDLSRRRAKSVYDALVSEGISASRLSYEGKGEAEPIASNDNAAGRRANRRTEFITFGDNSGGGDCTTYETRTYQKLVSDASSSAADVPAQYTTRTYKKIASDASVNSSSIPEVYETRSFQKLASSASTTTTEIPAQYNTVTKRNLVTPGGFTEWREVVCSADITPGFYRQIQQALNDRGYDAGPVDGQVGARTKAALVKFQRDNNLPIGSMDIETLKALGVQR